jgi:uncharacterized protein YbjT (DUF2867 family)
MVERSVTMLGASGMLGRPVARGLLRAGFRLTVMSRNPDSLAGLEGATRARGDIFDRESLLHAFEGRDAVYLNLRAGNSPRDPQPETDGLRNVIDAAKATGVRRIAMISSMVHEYQGINGFHWWAFDLKRESAAILRDSGLEWTLFRPSSFMENFLDSYRNGNRIMLSGKSRNAQWFIAGDDYAAQVARSLDMDSAAGRDYAVQGPEPLTTDAAARIFVEHYRAETLRISRLPLWPLRLAGLVSRPMSDLWHIIEALNEYREEFRSERTWDELGHPRITLAEFARRASRSSAGA